MVKTCLGSDDPFAKEVSGGVLEGDFVTLRRAQVGGGTHHPWYLIFSVDKGKILTDQELERDLFFISDKLSYLEFIIPYESRDIFTDLEPLLLRQARWGGTFDGLSELINNAIRFLPTVSGGLLKKVYLEMGRLVLPIRQIQSSLEKVSSDVAQVKRRFDGYRDSTEDFWDRNFTYSPCPNTQFNDLRETLLDAYPYHYLKQPLQSLKEFNEQLLGGAGRSVETVNSMLQQADRITQESLEVWTRRLGIIAALAAPALALPNFIDLKLDSTTFSNTIFGRVFHSLQDLQTFIGYLLSAVLAILFIASIAFVISWLWSLVSKKKAEKFISDVRSFEALVEQSKHFRNEPRKLEKLDTEATQFLSSLWAEAHDLRNTDTKTSFTHWLLNFENFVRRQLKIVKRRNGQMQSVWRKILLRIQSLGFWLLSLVLKGLLTISTQLERWLNQSESREVYEWLRQSQYFRYLVYLFDLTPNYIPLPRALCVYRYKADDFIARTTISDWDFERSLRSVGFDTEMIQHLDQWLQALYNRGGIRSISIDDFVDSLEQRGVRAYPEQQAVEQWHGFLDVDIDS